MFALLQQVNRSQTTINFSLLQDETPLHWWLPGSRGEETSWHEDCQKNAGGCRVRPEPSTSSWIVRSTLVHDHVAGHN
jgi:hypothetical protein